MLCCFLYDNNSRWSAGNSASVRMKIAGKDCACHQISQDPHNKLIQWWYCTNTASIFPQSTELNDIYVLLSCGLHLHIDDLSVEGTALDLGLFPSVFNSKKNMGKVLQHHVDWLHSCIH